MLEDSVIGDVREAKKWVDAQANSVAALGERLLEIEAAYRARTGEYSGVPVARPPSVTARIAGAADEPGRDLLSELKPAS